jgi:hypothetical protein
LIWQRTNVFAVHGVDAAGKPALVRPNVPRDKLLAFIASLPHRHGGLLGRPPLGQGVRQARPHRTPASRTVKTEFSGMTSESRDGGPQRPEPDGQTAFTR